MMETPSDSSLPFFAYGLFRPGQLGYLRLKPHVARVESGWSLHGNLLDRDGLPIFDPQGDGDVQGALIWFRESAVSEAYESIVAIEPAKQYRWDKCESHFGTKVDLANALVGRSPKKGTVPLDEEWDGKKDPLFTAALEVVRDTLIQNKHFEWDLKPLFRVEMAYLLLWAAIERYASLRYHLGDKVTAKVKGLAREPAFRSALAALPEPPEGVTMRVFRADDPQEEYRLEADNPSESLDFYYQIRNNATHRGKAVTRDFELLSVAAEQLLYVFEKVLKAAFIEAER